MWRFSFPKSNDEEELKFEDYVCLPDLVSFKLLSHMKSTEIDPETKNKPYVVKNLKN